MKTIDVQFFAAYRDATGVAHLSLEFDKETAEELFADLRDRFPDLVRFPAAKVAINDELATWASLVRDGDQVLLFPPVAGG